MLMDSMSRDLFIRAYRSEAGMSASSWLPCGQTDKNHGRTGLVPALAGGAQA
jgi:hypothetical protein